MSNKCGACGKFISPADSAKCKACSAFYHKGCVNLPNAGAIPSSWRCPECTRNIVRDNKCDTPVRGLAPTTANTPEGREMHKNYAEVNPTAQEPTELIINLKLLSEELFSVRAELRMFRAEMAELTTTIKKCNERMDNLEARVVTLEQQHLQVSGADAIIAEFRQELNERDQQLLENDIEIGNLPETNGENPIHLVNQIAVKLGLTIKESDVVSAERVGGYTISATSAAGAERRPRPLVVRLARRQLRDDLLKAARVRRGATTEDLGMSAPPQRFYINERLKYNRSLFRKAREAGHRCGWKFVWTRRGRVLARKEPGDVASTIRCEEDILRVFGISN